MNSATRHFFGFMWSGLPALLLGLSHPAGAASNADLVSSGTLSVERTNSPKAHIGRVTARTENGELVIHGKLHKRLASRKPIPGHIHLRLYGESGNLLAETTQGYRHKSTRSRLLSFIGILPMNSGDPVKLAVIHHDHRG